MFKTEIIAMAILSIGADNFGIDEYYSDERSSFASPVQWEVASLRVGGVVSNEIIRVSSKTYNSSHFTTPQSLRDSLARPPLCQLR